ncbi:hypothetical protein RJ55_01250 [Drechmeria coniospora]|nr:hypothetical protein RJ55_01250 [Drechmeria coniospora]
MDRKDQRVYKIFDSPGHGEVNITEIDVARVFGAKEVPVSMLGKVNILAMNHPGISGYNDPFKIQGIILQIELVGSGVVMANE